MRSIGGYSGYIGELFSEKLEVLNENILEIVVFIYPSS